MCSNGASLFLSPSKKTRLGTTSLPSGVRGMIVLTFIFGILINLATDKAIDIAADKVVSEYQEYKEKKANEAAGP